MGSNDAIVEIQGLKKSYRMGELDVPVLQGVDLRIERGSMHAILGPSGCGKTTLLNILGALDAPSSGVIRVDGVDLGAQDDAGRTRYRQEKIGFVFQFFNLMPLLTAVENVELGLEVVPNFNAQQVHSRSQEVLAQVGLKDQMNKFPSQLSGGQQQRVAIARALAKKPALMLCDEPTGNLDAKTSGHVLELMKELNRSLGATFVIVTHDPSLAKQCTHVTQLLDGVVQTTSAQAA